jgi:hypothetical protein
MSLLNQDQKRKLWRLLMLAQNLVFKSVVAQEANMAQQTVPVMPSSISSHLLKITLPQHNSPHLNILKQRNKERKEQDSKDQPKGNPNKVENV